MILGVSIAIDRTGAAIIIIGLLIASEIITATGAGFFNSLALFLGRACRVYELFHSLSW